VQVNGWRLDRQYRFKEYIMGLKKDIRHAQKECANYDCGNCTGVMLTVIKGEHSKKLVMWRDKELEGQKCIAGKDCKYYEQYVKQLL